MNRAEVTELRARFKKDKNSFSRIAGCYVNENKEIVCSFNESFQLLSEDESFKYLDIASRTLSGKLGDALLPQEFSIEEETNGECHRSLLLLNQSGLADDEINRSFFEKLIREYAGPAHYLILLFADRYDVPVKTKDGMDNAVSDAVYSYTLCAVCPVELSDPGLSYTADTNSIGCRVRDWVVGKPESGFLFPAFTDRSTDIHTALVYSRNPKEPHRELGEKVLGVSGMLTASEQRSRLKSLVLNAMHGDQDSEELYDELHYGFSEAIRAEEELQGEGVTVPLDGDRMDRVLEELALGEEKTGKIKEAVLREFEEREEVSVNSLLDERRIKAGEKSAERKELLREINALSGNVSDAAGVLRAYGNGALAERREIDGESCFVIRNAEKLILNGQEIR